MKKESILIGMLSFFFEKKKEVVTAVIASELK